MRKTILIIYSEKETPFNYKFVECFEEDYERISKDFKENFNFISAYYAELLEKRNTNDVPANACR